MGCTSRTPFRRRRIRTTGWRPGADAGGRNSTVSAATRENRGIPWHRGPSLAVSVLALGLQLLQCLPGVEADLLILVVGERLDFGNHESGLGAHLADGRNAPGEEIQVVGFFALV